MKDILLNVPKNKRKLKLTAIPSINVPVQPDADEEKDGSVSSRQQQLVREALEEYERETGESGNLIGAQCARRSKLFSEILTESPPSNDEPTFRKACPLCLSAHDADELNASMVSDELQRKLRQVFPFTIHLDSVQCVICKDCLERINDFYLFAERVRRNQSTLQAQQLTISRVQEDNLNLLHQANVIEIGDAEYHDAVQSGKSRQANPRKESTQELAQSKLIDEFYRMECTICNQRIEGWSKLRLHYRNRHRRDAWVTCCNRKLTQRSMLLDHIAIHMGLTPFACEQCKRRFRHANSLKVHRQKAHSVYRPFRCTQCPKAYSTRMLLKQHEAYHVRVKCAKCDRILANVNSLRCHMIYRHAREEALVCDLCGRTLGTRHALKQHLMYHHGSKEQCAACGRWYSQKTIKGHRLAHEWVGERYRCAHCQRSFLSVEFLKAHKLHEHGLSRYECELCGKRYKYSIGLKQHIATHAGVRLYACPQCEFTTNNKGNIYTHRKRKHADVTGESSQHGVSAIEEPSLQTATVPTSCRDETILLDAGALLDNDSLGIGGMQLVQLQDVALGHPLAEGQVIEIEGHHLLRSEKLEKRAKEGRYSKNQITFEISYVDGTEVFLQGDELQFPTF
ncbi:zinc finger protein 814-like [Anopheles bellator]|uniref:zinc finger protein 814-like n=1 Tax=Anopheles bellator TaxID=139047 RepID=UPI002647C14B|nr:zinc finger protein 814-like [Anopheles bellator]